MNTLELVLKQMRQRALSTWLTLISVMLGVALAVAILVLGRESQNLFGQHEYGYDVLVGKKASKLQLVLNTIYHMDVSPGNIPFAVYGRLLPGGDLNKDAKIAVPTCVGDTYKGIYRIVGVSPKMFGKDDEGNPLPPDETIEYRPGQRYQIADGKVFAGNRFEAVVGSDIPKLTDLKVGVPFQATHGVPLPGQTPDIHQEHWTVVGVLAPTHTASDRAIYIPLNSFYTIAEHGTGLVAQQALRNGDVKAADRAASAGEDDDDDGSFVKDPDGTEHHKNYTVKDGVIHITLPPDVRALSAILVQSRGGNTAQDLMYDLNNGTDVMACNPAETMREFFDAFLKPSRLILLVICSLVTVVAAVSILVSIYNSVSARVREIAILRALGATRSTVLTLICVEAGLIGLAGAILGWLIGHGLSGVGSVVMQEKFGEGIHWLQPDGLELLYLLGVVVLAALAGLVPAMKAYQTPVATNLVAG